MQLADKLIAVNVIAAFVVFGAGFAMGFSDRNGQAEQEIKYERNRIHETSVVREIVYIYRDVKTGNTLQTGNAVATCSIDEKGSITLRR
jgi:hypothetical protein